MRKYWLFLAVLLIGSAVLVLSVLAALPSEDSESASPSTSLAANDPTGSTLPEEATDPNDAKVFGPPEEGTYDPALPSYGAGAVGPSVEECETEGTVVDPKEYPFGVVWPMYLVRAAPPGSVFLLRGGVYYGGLKIPPGIKGHPTVVKPYNCESVKILGKVEVDSWTVVAGLYIESSDDYAVLANGNSTKPITDVVIRNNRIRGGQTEAIRVARNVHRMDIIGNDLDGGVKRHVLKVHWEGSAWRPSEINIVNNVFHKDETGTGTDLIQLEGHQTVRIENNTFRDGGSENGIDVKSAGLGGGVAIVRNYFDGANIQAACLLIQGDFALNYISDNYFDNGCKVSLGAHPEQQLSPWWRFEGNTIIEGTLQLRRSFDAEILNNTMEGGTLKLGLREDDHPRNAVIKFNTFVGVELIDRVGAAGDFYACTANILSNVTGNWNGCRD